MISDKTAGRSGCSAPLWLIYTAIIATLFAPISQSAHAFTKAPAPTPAQTEPAPNPSEPPPAPTLAPAPEPAPEPEPEPEPETAEPPAPANNAPFALVLAALSLTALGVIIWKRLATIPPSLPPQHPAHRRLADITAPQWLAAALACYIIFQFAGAAIAPALSAMPQTQKAALTSLTAFGTMAIAATAVAIALSRHEPNAGFKLALTDPLKGLAAFALTIPIVLLTGLIATMIARAIRGSPTNPIAHDTLARIAENPTDTWIILTMITACTLTPIAEELVYRGFLQTAIRKFITHRWPAVAITSVLFTLAHYSVVQNGPQALATLFVLSLAMGWAFERTGRIAVPITMHIAFNTLNVTLAILAT